MTGCASGYSSPDAGLHPGHVGHAAALVADGSFLPVSGTAFAVTPTLRESYAEGDDDELAEVALREAALASLRLLAVDQARPDGEACRRAARCWSPTSARLPHARISTTRWCGSAGRWHRDQVVAVYVDIAAAEPAVTGRDGP